jgi:hypothetical protein
MSQRNTSRQKARRKEVENRVSRAYTEMTHGKSASRAARENGISLRTLKEYAGGALMQDRPGGHIRPARTERLPRYLQIPGQNGPKQITVRGLKTASKVAKYKADINRALAGDLKALAKWDGKKIAGVELITDVKVLAEQADKGLLPYSLYRSLSGGRG